MNRESLRRGRADAPPAAPDRIHACFATSPCSFSPFLPSSATRCPKSWKKRVPCTSRTLRTTSRCGSPAEAPLAYIARAFMGRDRHLVVFHPVLNHRQTPVEVLRFLAKHELTHIVRPPRLIDGYGETHPPEFWEHEAEIGPERYAAWAWIYKNLGRCLRRGDQGIRVTGKWRAIRETARTPYMPSLPFNGERWERICPGGGAQLHLPPDWVRRPMPLRDAGPGRSEQRRLGVSRTLPARPATIPARDRCVRRQCG
jgi:hypothetical protein